MLKCRGPVPGTRACPTVINNSPVGLNFRTWWSMTVTQTLSWESMVRPCGIRKRSAPQERRCRPLRPSKTSIVEPLIASPGVSSLHSRPARWKTKTFPRESMSTPVACPKIRPSGSSGQPCTTSSGWTGRRGWVEVQAPNASPTVRRGCLVRLTGRPPEFPTPSYSVRKTSALSRLPGSAQAGVRGGPVVHVRFPPYRQIDSGQHSRGA